MERGGVGSVTVFVFSLFCSIWVENVLDICIRFFLTLFNHHCDVYINAGGIRFVLFDIGGSAMPHPSVGALGVQIMVPGTWYLGIGTNVFRRDY